MHGSEGCRPVQSYHVPRHTAVACALGLRTVRRSVLEESHLATSEIVALFHRANTDDHSERFSVKLESIIRGFYEVAALKKTERCKDMF